ncbi:MAG TPA: hypothetical protein VM029_06300 [Opitutaceae bacterium]|nr:hypothetical protein [Opitutaceae bacterium]
MNADIARVVGTIVAANVAAMFVLVALSFLGGAWALDGLEKLDVWLRRKGEDRSRPVEDKADHGGQRVSTWHD